MKNEAPASPEGAAVNVPEQGKKACGLFCVLIACCAFGVLVGPLMAVLAANNANMPIMRLGWTIFGISLFLSAVFAMLDRPNQVSGSTVWLSLIPAALLLVAITYPNFIGTPPDPAFALAILSDVAEGGKVDGAYLERFAAHAGTDGLEALKESKIDIEKGEQLAEGEKIYYFFKRGYQFELRLTEGAASEFSCVAMFTAVSHPNYYIDQTGVVRVSMGYTPPNSNSEPLHVSRPLE